MNLSLRRTSSLSHGATRRTGRPSYKIADGKFYPAARRMTLQPESSITGKTIERATLPEFDAFMKQEYPDSDLEGEVLAAEAAIDRFQIYRSLLRPLLFFLRQNKV